MAEKNTNVEPLPTPPEEDFETVRMMDIEGVRYVGRADVKTLTVADLESVGVVNPKGDLRWSAEDNQHFVPKNQFNASTLDWFLTQPDFSVVQAAPTVG
jgi:hypothetical protein